MALIHILDSQSDKIIGTLDTSKGQVKEPIMTRSIDNFHTFEMTGLVQFDKLTKRNRLLVQDADGFFNEFIITYADQFKRTAKEVRSLGSFVDLQKAKVISPQDIDLTGATPASALTAALDATEWKPGIVEYTGSFRTIKLVSHTDPYSLLKLIASTFDLELRFRVVVKGNRIVGRFVDLVERIAGFEGKETEYGKDLVGIRRVEDTSNIVTALLGLGPIREDGTRLEVFVEDKDALARWGRNGNHLIQVYEPTSTDTEMTIERLRSLTQTELKKRVEAAVMYECKAVSLEHVFGYEHERVRLGQTVRIKDDGYTPPLYLEARIRETVENIATSKVVDFKIGNYIEHSKADLEKQIAALKTTMSERLANMIYATVTSSSGTIFKNGIGSTTLTANALLSGVEFDADGTKYTYVWSKYDKHGYPVAGWSATGKTLSVSAVDVDEKAIYMVSVSNDKINVPAQITISNVFDGADGTDGTNGTDGKDGVDGVSVTSVTNYYLASALSSGVTTSTTGWTTAVQNPTSSKKYLWNYEKTTLSNGTSINTTPTIIGNYAADGSSGRGISNIVEYYQVSNSNTVAPTSWVTTPPATTPANKYLWNYERITYTDNSTSDTPKRVIGTHGDTGADGADGKGVTSVIEEYYHSTSATVLVGGTWSTTVPAWADGKYVWVRTKVTYTDNTSTTTDPVNVTGQTGANGVTTYSWRMYADDDKGTGISASPAGKRWIGWAHNKTSATPSNTPTDYAWSPLYDNVVVGGRNLLAHSDMNNLSGWIGNGGASIVMEGNYLKNVFPSSTSTPGIRSAEKISLDKGIYTLSVKMNTDNLLQTRKLRMYLIGVGQVHKEIERKIGMSVHTVTFEIENDRIDDYFYILSIGSDQGDFILYDWIKLEKGNIATDWTPAPEDVEQSIADAKDTAITAKTTADGKNTVLYSNVAPPITGRKPGDVWFKTNDGYKMHRFDGTGWVVAQFGENAIVANSITANHIKSLLGLNVADQFIVDASGVRFMGDLTGARGTFSDKVEVGGAGNDGVIKILDSNDEDAIILDALTRAIDRLYVANFSSPSVIMINRENLFFYVDPINGNDENSGVDWTNARQTIQSCIDSIPKHNDGIVTIVLHYDNAKNIYEDIEIHGFTGTGEIKILGQIVTNRIFGSVSVDACDNYVSSDRFTIVPTGDVGFKAFRSKYVSANLVHVWGQPTGYAFAANFGGNLRLTNCHIDNMAMGISAREFGQVYVDNCTGISNTYGMVAQLGGVIRGRGTAPTGKTANTYKDGAGDIIGSFTYPTQPTPPAPPPTTSTVEYKSASGSTYNVSQGYWDDAYGFAGSVVQGAWNGGRVAKGAWFFGSQLSAVVGKSIKSMRVWVQRENVGGNGGSVTVTIKPHNYSTRPAGNPAFRGESVNVSLARGEGKWVTLPSSFYAPFAANTAKGIGIEAISNTNAYYARLIKDAWIEVTYQ
ncbi:phage tail spike protein [Sporosarcina saromensis]|uniref:Phage tail spike protein n=1 Tax=Sporosarcina saromensis TaxID=359365 RepID=A0ABU4G9U1_9BACL|nr:phage tail spike protein [Sporosarcina saromensis]MDW0113758.1 phage tail spike protein [Sporosarcina saromensis]